MSGAVASPVAESDPYTHITLTLGGGARTYLIRPVPAGTATGAAAGAAAQQAFEIRCDLWNGLKFKQSVGIRIIAESASSLVSNALHWIGSQAPYSACSEELEGRQPVRIARYGNDSHASLEEAFSMVGKLSHPDGGEFALCAPRAAAVAFAFITAGSPAIFASLFFVRSCADFAEFVHHAEQEYKAHVAALAKAQASSAADSAAKVL